MKANCMLVPVDDMLVQQLAIFDDIARMPVLLSPVAHHLHRDIVEVPGIRVRLEELTEFVPEAFRIQAQRR